jgi:hypothetical protein
MAITALGRRMIDEGIENLGSALRLLDELVHEGRSDADIANRMEAFAIAVAVFTRRSSWYKNDYHTQLLKPAGKFNKTWRELLEIALAMYQTMRRWHADGYDYINFYQNNSHCYPCTENEQDTRKQYTGSWSTLDKMISVYCHGGALLERTPLVREVIHTND